MPWVEQVYEQIDYWLTQELDGHSAKIFFDKNTIETGTNWPDKLRMGVKKSRCMVGIWSPEYFRSKWCVAEWQSFHQRQQILHNHGHSVILPMRFHDGDAFPEEAKQIQSLDVREYTSLFPSFWQTTKSVELEKLIKQLCCTVAATVKNSPDYDPSWPTLEPDPAPLDRVELRRL